MINTNTPIWKDWFLVGLGTGMAAAVTKSVANFLAGKAGLPTVPYGVIAGNMVLGRREPLLWRSQRKVISREERVIGALSDVVFGGILGVVTSFIYSKTPPGNEMIKGTLGGAAIWAATFTIPNQMRVTRVKPTEMVTLLGMDMLYGAIQGALIGRFGSQMIQQSHPLLVKEVTSSSFQQGRLSTRGRSQALM